MTFELRSSFNSRRERKVEDNGKAVDIVTVEVDKQISRKRCVESETYSFRDNVVVARRGCQARFKVCYQKQGQNPTPTARSGCIRIRLITNSNRIVKQRIPEEQGRIVSISPAIRFGGSKCDSGTYGIRGREVYSSSGCKAEFEVCLSGGTVTDSPQQTCINVYLASSRSSSDWTKISERDGSPVKIENIRVISETSDVSCIQSVNFFIRNKDEVHVNKGCSARFRVCYSRL